MKINEEYFWLSILWILPEEYQICFESDFQKYIQLLYQTVVMGKVKKEINGS